jgi:ribonucleoside-triphosphate reductase
MTENISKKFVKKRDNSLEEYNEEKITNVLIKVKNATNEDFDIQSIQDKVINTLVFSDNIIDIESIQDSIERTFFHFGKFDILKAFSSYREKRNALRTDKAAISSGVLAINGYLEKEDWRVKANANSGYSLGGLILNIAGRLTANYWLNHVYTKEIANHHISGDFHIHDLDILG